MADIVNNGLGQAWESDSNFNCMSVWIPKEAIGKYPYVDTAPDSSFVDPKYDWSSHSWIDLNANKQAKALSDLKESTQTLSQQLDSQNKIMTGLMTELAMMGMATDTGTSTPASTKNNN